MASQLEFDGIPCSSTVIQYVKSIGNGGWLTTQLVYDISDPSWWVILSVKRYQLSQCQLLFKDAIKHTFAISSIVLARHCSSSLIFLSALSCKYSASPKSIIYRFLDFWQTTILWSTRSLWIICFWWRNCTPCRKIQLSDKCKFEILISGNPNNILIFQI